MVLPLLPLEVQELIATCFASLSWRDAGTARLVSREWENIVAQRINAAVVYPALGDGRVPLSLPLNARGPFGISPFFLDVLLNNLSAAVTWSVLERVAITILSAATPFSDLEHSTWTELCARVNGDASESAADSIARQCGDPCTDQVGLLFQTAPLRSALVYAFKWKELDSEQQILNLLKRGIWSSRYGPVPGLEREGVVGGMYDSLSRTERAWDHFCALSHHLDTLIIQRAEEIGDEEFMNRLDVVY